MELESVQIPNFLSEDRVDVVSKFYFEVCEILGCKVHQINFNNITSKVDYVSGTKYEDFDYRYCPSIEKQYTDDKIINYKKVPEDKIKELYSGLINNQKLFVVFFGDFEPFGFGLDASPLNILHGRVRPDHQIKIKFELFAFLD